MARMIPPAIHAGCTSPGEKEIFRRIQDDPTTSDWIVLHSLDIANHVSNIAGEVDFVLIVPGKGVLCVEVKASRRISCRDGQWYYGSTVQPDPRGPFKQASQAMHSIRKWTTDRRPDLSRVLFWSAVVFPYVDFAVESDEWHSWQIIDGRAFRSRPIAQLLLGVLDNARRFMEGHGSRGWFFAESKEPYPDQCAVIADVLRPEFELYESPKVQARRREDELKRYTDEQFDALDAMNDNPRVAFVGPAGTGKTLLAIETAQRAHQAGHRALLLCYNRLLGKWLEEQTTALQPQVVVRTLHKHMLAVAGVNAPHDPTQEFWEVDLPLLAIDKLLEEPTDEVIFDEIIVDEAQDLLKENYLDFLDLSLKGGLATGRIRLFGDFEKQAIYGSANLSVQDVLNTRCNGASQYALRTNCRNTPRVAEMAHLLGGLSPGYRRVLRPDDGIEPELQYYADDDNQERMLVAALEELYNDGFSGNDIVVLSPHRNQDSAASAVHASPWKDRLRPIDSATAGHVRYCSIHAFKGMEAPVIVVTDIEEIAGFSATTLFYIAVTRPVCRLIILVHEKVKAEVPGLLLGHSYRETVGIGR